jgi:hypothetical protein
MSAHRRPDVVEGVEQHGASAVFPHALETYSHSTVGMLFEALKGERRVAQCSGTLFNNGGARDASGARPSTATAAWMLTPPTSASAPGPKPCTRRSGRTSLVVLRPAAGPSSCTSAADAP